MADTWAGEAAERSITWDKVACFFAVMLAALIAVVWYDLNGDIASADEAAREAGKGAATNAAALATTREDFLREVGGVRTTLMQVGGEIREELATVRGSIEATNAKLDAADQRAAEMMTEIKRIAAPSAPRR